MESGITKAVLSAFVADEAGIINRVAGVFARRGANIESLAVGLNIDKALFTIVVAGSRSTVANLVKQTAKLVKVRYVEDISRSPRVERELVLFKVAAPSSAGSLRAEVLQLADIFRARVVDVGPECVTLCCTGDAGKSAALQRALESTSGGMNSKNGNGKSIVREIARTGRVALKRGPALLEMGGWGTRALRRPQPPLQPPPRNPAGKGRATGSTGAEKVEVEMAIMPISTTAQISRTKLWLMPCSTPRATRSWATLTATRPRSPSWWPTFPECSTR